MRASIRRSSLVVAALLLLSTGCLQQQTRLQSEDEGERDRDKDSDIKTIGDVTSVANANPIFVSGLGLVVNLDGTGGKALPGGYRTLMEDQLRKRNVPNIKELLASTSTSIVIVSAMIPAGARKGDVLDVEVTLPPQSKTTSLRGGHLMECILYNHDMTRNLDPNYAGADRTLKGHPLAKASGPLLVGYGNGDEAAKLRQGRIWGGGRCAIDRPFYLLLNSDVQRAPVAQKVADRVNETMQGPYHGAISEMAAAKNNQVVFLNVPEQYKHNLPRYLRVVRLIPLRTPSAGYQRRLEENLLDPKLTVTAALRLEALGSQSVDGVKKALTSDHALVRFSAAESLAYLGSPACGEELGRLVEEQPALRAYSLTAMASLNENVCRVKLGELLSSSSPEARYGAFRALRALDEREPLVQGDLLNESFWLHRLAPNSPSLVHLSHSRRAEVVLFGEEAFLVPPFSFLAGDFTITANRDDNRCTIACISARRGVNRKQCTLAIEDVLRTVAAMGAGYPQIDELLQQAHKCSCLSCPLKIDALPQATSIYQLAKDGADDPDFVNTDEDIINARKDFGATPTLFDKSVSRRVRPTLDREEEDVLLDKDKKPKNEKAAVKR